MSAKLPSDPEEADAVHRRFLPYRMMNHEEDNGGTGTSKGGSRRTSEDADAADEPLKGEKDKLKKDAADAENNFLPLNSEIPDYGATGQDGGGGEVNGDSNGDSEIGIDYAPVKRLASKEERFGFDWQFVKRFYRLQGILFLSVCSVSGALFLFLLGMALLYEYIGYQVGMIASGFYKTLGDKDLQGFWIQTLKSLGLILAVAFVKSTYMYLQKVLTVTFRRTLCEAAHRIYFSDIRFYQLNVLDKAIDNPDQRMTQDIDKFCTSYCDVLPKLLTSPFTIGYYCYQGYLRSGWLGPLGCFVFFLISSGVNKVLMTPIVNYVFKQERREGDFRFLHMLIRVNSESIAFQRASLLEHGKVDAAFEKLANTQHQLYLRQYFLGFFTNFIDYIGSIFSYLMLAIPIFSGEYNHLTPSELGALISQNAFVLIYLIYTFTGLVGLSAQFSDIAGVTHRISQLFERLNALDEFWKETFPNGHGGHPDPTYFDEWIQKRQNIREKLVTFKTSNQDYIQVDKDCSRENSRKLPIWSLDNLTFSKPVSQDPLISHLTMQFVVGESVLISGTSSAGKTSILRVLRGLWPYSDGILRNHFPPGPHGVYFCPQKSYLTWGTLREQISFPLCPDASHLDDKLIMYYLDRLRLSPVSERVGGLDEPCSWSVYDSLSPGEAQRLCILRVFYHQPVVAILDEVTSALPLDIEEFVYSELKRLGITLISVGHRESIRKYHDKQLILDARGGWGIYPIVHE